MNFDLLFAVLFYGLLIWFFFKKREKWEVHGKIIALYKTQLGVKAMEKLASKFCHSSPIKALTEILFSNVATKN